jgi:hypothetical protein
MTLLIVALLVGSAAAFTQTERLKLARPPVEAERFTRYFSPGCDCRHETARLRFLLRRADRLDVAVVDEGGNVVRNLANRLERSPGRFELDWVGTDDAGRIVPDGIYRVRVELDEAGRRILLPTELHVDTTPPDVRLLSVSRTTLSLGATGADGTIALRYTANERGWPILLVDGKKAARGDAHRPGATVFTWDGAFRSRTIGPGAHELALTVRDRAGNRSVPTTAVRIDVLSATG